ncbi:MAG: substrate-binding domain-containing protein [Myxococcota bacterium]
MKHVSLSISLWLVVGCASSNRGSGDFEFRGWVDWPRFGDSADALELRGHTNEVADLIGPLDGSATLTVFTEGNHFPVLVPMISDELSSWSSYHCDQSLAPDEVLVVTLPQVMIVKALAEERIRLGSAVVPLSLDRVYPDVVMGGREPLGNLAKLGRVRPEAVAFAKHAGLGLLIHRRHVSQIDSLEALADSDLTVVLATPEEAGARSQYLETLDAIIGTEQRERLLRREISSFPGRLGIQHRDVPYALLTGQADVGLIFGHLATFYSGAYPKDLLAIRVPKAKPFGRELYLAQTSDEPSPAADCFERFVLGQAGNMYPSAGFVSPGEFEFRERIQLTD